MNEYLKNLYLENLIKEFQPGNEEERALLRTVLENNLLQAKLNLSSLYGSYCYSEQEADYD